MTNMRVLDLPQPKEKVMKHYCQMCEKQFVAGDQVVVDFLHSENDEAMATPFFRHATLECVPEGGWINKLYTYKETQ